MPECSSRNTSTHWPWFAKKKAKNFWFSNQYSTRLDTERGSGTIRRRHHHHFLTTLIRCQRTITRLGLLLLSRNTFRRLTDSRNMDCRHRRWMLRSSGLRHLTAHHLSRLLSVVPLCPARICPIRRSTSFLRRFRPTTIRRFRLYPSRFHLHHHNNSSARRVCLPMILFRPAPTSCRKCRNVPSPSKISHLRLISSRI